MRNTIVKLLAAAAVIISFTAVSACSKAKDKEAGEQTPTTETAPDPNAPPATPTPAAPEIPDEDLPVETDFEDEAENSITADNFKQELEALEKEIAEEQ